MLLCALLTPALAVTAAPAHAVILSADRACYREGEPVRLAGGPFTPNGIVDVSLDGARLPEAYTADPAGDFAARLPAPTPGQAPERAFRIDASDRANPAVGGSAAALVSTFGVTVSPARGAPAGRRLITARGFTSGGTLYAHVTRGHRRRTVAVGRLTGACGSLRARMRILPRRPHRGTYRVQFDTRRAYRSKTLPRVVYRVPVARRFRLRGAISSSGPPRCAARTRGLNVQLGEARAQVLCDRRPHAPALFG